ncbi:hypothetical protein BV898_17837 [Hypsibius exemplaris]|uniref:Uncharacterized protein n=1 Tax=Hypsibius exemplaris TaxID=2072580 RepID=A0A9X6NIM8_HYPEX|nr:hypothetical protein BV898_17837 [Hypsibius exemplaris]
MIRLCEPAILTPSCSVILRPFALRSGDPSLCNLAALRPCDHCPCNPATLQPGDLDNLHYCERGAPGNPRHCDLATLQLSRLATLTTSTTASLRPGDPAALQIGDPETLRPLLLSSLVPHTSAWCWFTPREDRCLEAEKLGQRIELIGKDTLTNDLEKGVLVDHVIPLACRSSSTIPTQQNDERPFPVRLTSERTETAKR